MRQSYKLSDQHFALDAPAGAVDLDQGKMSAGCIFAANSLDRVGDVLNIQGIRTENHRKNAQVLFNHKSDGLDDSVGQTYDPDGNYTVLLRENDAYQTTFFCQKNLLAEQLYDRIVAGQIRANSIGYRPLKKRKNDQGGYFLDEVELLECSWVIIGANQDAIRSTLSRDKFCGKSLHPLLRSAFEAKLLPSNPTVWVPGRFLMSKLAKTKAEDTTQEQPAAGAGATQEVQEEAPMPHGAELLTAYHSALAQAVKVVEEHLPRLENDQVEKLILKGLKGVLTTMKGIEESYKSEYPDCKALPEIATAALAEEETEQKTDGDEETEEPGEKDGEEADAKKKAKKDEGPDVKALAVQVKDIATKLDKLLSIAGDEDEEVDLDGLVEQFEALSPWEQKQAIATLQEFVGDEQDEFRRELEEKHDRRLLKAFNARNGLR